MSKFLHRDHPAFSHPEKPPFNAADAIGIVWPRLPWTCPGCRNVFSSHADTVATLDLELAVSIAQTLSAIPRVLSETPEDKLDGAGAAIAAYARYASNDWLFRGPPAGFLCVQCDLLNLVRPVVHLLEGGRSFCAMPNVPGLWPKQHRWVGRDQLADVNCPLCRQIHTMLIGNVS